MRMPHGLKAAGLAGMGAAALVVASCGRGVVTNVKVPEPAAIRMAMSLGADDRVAGLSFLEGTWVVNDGGEVSEETWSAPCGRGMVGMFRMVKQDGTMGLQEAISITAEENGVLMRLRHFDGAMTPWKSEAEGPIVLQLETMQDRSAVFRIVSGSKTLDAISYRRVGEDGLESVVVFTPESGRERLTFEMKRVK